MSPIALLWVVALPLLGGVAAWLAQRWSLRSPLPQKDRAERARVRGDSRAPRWIAVATLAADLALVAILGTVRPSHESWILRLDLPWIPELGIGLRLGLDGLSWVLLLLTFFLGLVAVAASWNEIQDRVGLFHLQLLWTLAGIAGVFLALDLVLFYFFWELMLVPMFLLVAVWGHERRIYAAIKFFLFTQAGGLLLLLAILGLGLDAGTFSYFELLGRSITSEPSAWLLLGFFVAFAVKLPVIVLHTWLPDAHTEAPTAGSVILAGLLLKTGAYGLLRFALPLFPDTAQALAPWGMALGAAGVLYGGWLAFAQDDAKRLVAYTSVAHLGFVLLGLAAWNPMGWHGAVLQMVCHGLSTGALFLIVGMLAKRLGTRSLDAMGGLWSSAPRMGVAALFFAMASLGLPGTGNFVAEILVLLGAFQGPFASAPWWTAAATAGLVIATVYSLWLVQKIFHGEPSVEVAEKIKDLDAREILMLASIALLLLWIGLYPQPLIDAVDPTIQELFVLFELGGATP